MPAPETAENAWRVLRARTHDVSWVMNCDVIVVTMAIYAHFRLCMQKVKNVECIWNQ